MNYAILLAFLSFTIYYNTVNRGGLLASSNGGAHVVAGVWNPGTGDYTFYNVDVGQDTRPTIQEYLDDFSSSLISITIVDG